MYAKVFQYKFPSITEAKVAASFCSDNLGKQITKFNFQSLNIMIGKEGDLSIFIKLADGDESKVETIKKIINKNFDLSPRGIREMLNLNNPIYEVTSAYGHFGRKPTNKGEFSWEKTDKQDLFKL